MRRNDFWPLAAVATLLVITAGWWALALWPLPSSAPVWIERARSVCFNTTESGLPDLSGWLLLTGQPFGMFALLVVGWGPAVRGSLRRLWAGARGRLVALATLVLVAGGGVATGVRVATARIPDPVLAGGLPAESYPRLDRTLPPMMAALVDQHGRAFDSARLGGRYAMITFAFGHCRTLCPMVVHAARTVRDGPAARRGFVLVVVTLDPWRDTPARLPALARQFGLDEDAGDLLLGGAVADVETVLDAWDIPRVRDAATGDITHPALVYLVEPDGTVAYASTGAPVQLAALAARLR